MAQAQQDWWKADPVVAQPGQAQPSSSGTIYIPEDPRVLADEARKAAAEGRAERSDVRSENAESRAAEAADRGTEGQSKSAVLLGRIRGGFSDILEVTARSPQSQEPGILETIRGGLSPVGVGGLVTRKLSDADRRIVHDSQVDILDALLTLGTGAAYNQEQLEGQLASYFPQYGDTPEEIEVKNRRLRRQIEAAKLAAGPLADDLEAAITPYLGRPIAQGKEEITSGPGLTDQDRGYKSALEQAWAGGATPDQLDDIARQYTGRPFDPEQKAVLQGLKPGSPVQFEVPASGDASAFGAAAASPVGAYFVGAANALTSGAMDELAPLLGMDAEQVQRAKEALREKYPVSSFVGEVSGAAMQMAGATKALGAAGIAAPKAAAIGEIGAGAAYGAGESNEDRLKGAAIGGVAAAAGRKIGQMIFGSAERKAIAEAADKAGVPAEAMEEVLSEVVGPGAKEATAQPLTEAAQQEIGEVARKAIGKGRSARAAKKQLAEMAKINPEAMAAAERLGVELPIDILSDDAQLKTITGLARSQIGSEAGAAWRETVTRVSQQADQALESLGATADIAQVGADVSARIDGSIKSLERQAAVLRREVDDAIDVRARADAAKTRGALLAIVEDMGGGTEGREALSTEARKLLASLERKGSEGIEEVSPTYARLNQLRDDIGDAAFKNKGPWKDASQKELIALYAALADDQLRHIESVGGKELADKMRGSNTLFSKMYDTQREMQAIFGEKLEKDLPPLISRAVTKASKGDAQDLRKLLSNVPEDMRGNVLMSGLMAKSTSRSTHGGFSFAEYAKTYRGLRQNAPVYKQFAEAIGPAGSQVLTDLYAISRRLAEGEGRIIRTGASNQPLLNALNAESLIAKTMQGAAGKIASASVGMATGGLAGRTAAEAIASTAQNAIGGAGKSRLEKLHGLLASEPFRELVEKVGTGQDAKSSINRVVGSKEYNNFAARVLGLKVPEQRRQWLQEAATATSAIGATRATETSEPATVKVIPQ